MSTKSETDDRPKKKKKPTSSAGVWIGLGIGGGVLLLLVIAGVVLAVTRPWDRGEDKQNVVAQNPQPQPQQMGKLGGDVVKNPRSTLGKARRRVDEIVRDSQMRDIVNLHAMYCEDNKNPNARTLDGFLLSIKKEPSRLVNAIREKDFTVNLKARPFSEDVVAYETEAYEDKTYYCVRANVQMSYLTADDLRAALGQ